MRPLHVHSRFFAPPCGAVSTPIGPRWLHRPSSLQGRVVHVLRRMASARQQMHVCIPGDNILRGISAVNGQFPGRLSAE